MRKKCILLGDFRAKQLKFLGFFSIFYIFIYISPSKSAFFSQFLGVSASAMGGQRIRRVVSASARWGSSSVMQQCIRQSVNMCHYATHSGFDGQLGAVVEACFDQHTVDVCLYRSLGYVKLVGNFGVGHSGGHEAKYIQLPL